MIFRLLSIFLYLLGGIYFICFGIYVILLSIIIGHKYLYPTLPFLTRIQLLLLGAWVRLKNKIPNDRTYIIMMNHTSFADKYQAARVPQNIGEYLMGHKSKQSSKVHSKYGTGRAVEELVEDMKAIVAVKEWGYFEEYH